MGLYVDTNGSNVTIQDLGLTLNHPTTNYSLLGQFSVQDIRNSANLTAAIQSGSLIWKYVSGGPTQPASFYDPDVSVIDEQETGLGFGTAVAYTLAASTLTLTRGHAGKIVFSGTTNGQIVRLPPANFLPLGRDYVIFNLGNQSIQIQYQDGSAFTIVPAGAKGTITLQNTSTANGQWFYVENFDNIASGVVNYKLISSTTFTTASATDVVITSFTVTPIAGTYAIWYNASISITSNNTIQRCTVYRAGTPVNDSIRAAQASGGGWAGALSTLTTVQFNGSQACDIRVRSTAGNISVLDRTLLLIRLGN